MNLTLPWKKPTQHEEHEFDVARLVLTTSLKTKREIKATKLDERFTKILNHIQKMYPMFYKKEEFVYFADVSFIKNGRKTIVQRAGLNVQKKNNITNFAVDIDYIFDGDDQEFEREFNRRKNILVLKNKQKTKIEVKKNQNWIAYPYPFTEEQQQRRAA